MAVEVPDGRSLDVKVTGNGCGFVWGSLINMERYYVSEPVKYHTFSTTSSGLCDVRIRFSYDYESPTNNLTFEYYNDGNTEPYFTKEVEILTDYVPVDSTLLK